jgi:Peptidase C13 family
MTRKLNVWIVAWVVLLLVLGGCATSPDPYKSDAKVASDALLQKQIADSVRPRLDPPQGRIIFAGFALSSRSKAFQADVESGERLARAIDPNAVIFKLNNPVAGQSADWPYASPENVERVLKKISELATPQDKVIVLFSTHGAPGLLEVNVAETPQPNIDSKFLKQVLAPLESRPVLLVLSACFSGSFIEPLGSPNRIILTAAARDRSSFGCQFQSTNTYFVDAFFNQPAAIDRSIAELMTQAKVDIDQREKAQKLAPPSLPQIAIGSASSQWAGQSLKSWVVAK